MSSRDTYYAAAATWADTAAAAERRSRRTAWIVAGAATLVAVLLALALVALTPLKSVQPYVVTVDKQTGAVQIATTVANDRLTENEAVIQASLANYVRARETFDVTDLAANYRRVQMMSATQARATYVADMASNNPQSPLRTLSPGDTVAITIKSISLLAPGTALVRFEANRRPAGSTTVGRQAYAAAVSYGFSGRPLRMEDRFDNPLGFEVTRYRRDAEGVGA